MPSLKEEFLETIFKHQALIYKICRLYRDSKEDREDLFQEIVYQLWKSYPGFKGNAKITSWMYRISLNTAIATFRKSKIVTSDIKEIPEEVLASRNEERYPQLEQMFEAIRQLEESDKALVSLYLEGLSYSEIAEIIGISENYIGVRLHRIKNKLKSILEI